MKVAFRDDEIPRGFPWARTSMQPAHAGMRAISTPKYSNGEETCFLRRCCYFSCLLPADLHLVDINAVGDSARVTVELYGIGELIAGPGEKRIVLDVHGKAHTIHGEGVMGDHVRGHVVVVFGDNVVPCAGCEGGKGDIGRVPAFGAVIEDPPHIQGVIGLPAKVIDPAIQNLLALKLKGLGSVLGAGRNINIELVRQSVDLVRNRRMRKIEVGISVGHGSRNRELSAAAIFAGRNDSGSERKRGGCTGCSVIAAVSAGQPMAGVLHIIQYVGKSSPGRGATRWSTSRGSAGSSTA